MFKTLLPLFAAMAAFAATASISQFDLGAIPWAVSRATGLGAFVTLTLAMVFGLLLTTRIGVSTLPRPLAFEMHQFFSVISLVLVGVHASALLFDHYVAFGVADILIPFAAPYAPVSVGLGIIAAWAISLVTMSFWVKRRIGHHAWRLIHYATFVSYAIALWHGLAAGSDTLRTPIFLIYVLSLAAVVSLLFYRVGERKHGRQRRGATGARPSHLPSMHLRDMPRS